MARMPAGTMRFAENAGQEFTSPINDKTKQSKVMDVIMPENSDADKSYRNALAKVLNLKGKVISDVTTDGPKGEVPIIKEKVIVSEPVVKPKEVLKFAEQMPEFNGGFLAMQKYLQKNIRYPQAALHMGTTGIVYVEFVIETDGAITDAKVIRGIGDGCDEEALRAVTNMPKWVPGKQNGQEVRVRTTVPIKFELEN